MTTVARIDDPKTSRLIETEDWAKPMRPQTEISSMHRANGGLTGICWIFGFVCITLSGCQNLKFSQRPFATFSGDETMRREMESSDFTLPVPDVENLAEDEGDRENLNRSGDGTHSGIQLANAEQPEYFVEDLANARVQPPSPQSTRSSSPQYPSSRYSSDGSGRARTSSSNRAATATIRGQSPPTDDAPSSDTRRTSYQIPSSEGLPAPAGASGVPFGSPNTFVAPAPTQTVPNSPINGGIPASPDVFNPFPGGPATNQGFGIGGNAGLGGNAAPFAGLNTPGTLQFNNEQLLPPGANGYMPNIRSVPLDVYLQEGRTGRFIFGGSVNTDLGVAGNITIEERNFDIRRWPTSFGDLFNGAFKGNGENFRMELMPGNQVQRYMVSWTQPNLFGYSPWSLRVSGHFFNRFYRDWSEERLGGSVLLGYAITPKLSVSTEFLGDNVEISDPRVAGVPALDNVLGDNASFISRTRLSHNTRDSIFLPTEGHNLELIFDQAFGSFDFSRGQINFSKYFMLRERPDGTGRHTLTNAWRVGFSGEDTPIYDNFFAGGHTTFRGFSFRGASPVEGGVQVGGRFMFLGSLEYMFPLTADDMVRGVAFVDYGTIERDIEFNSESFRVAPGLGLRIAVPALGPAPLAFDFAYPINSADTDDRQVFSFSAGITR